MYALSMLSNLNSNYPAETQQDLYNQADKVKMVLAETSFQDFAGKWSVVWGPGLLSKEEKPSTATESKWVAHNAMFMLKKEGCEEYFIGVAGTNGISAFDWFKEDFEVSTMVAWPPKYLNAGKLLEDCKIAEGTNTGLEILWKMKGSQEKETTLFEYITQLLTNLGPNKCTIAIGGHSLGGCLAPVLGVALVDALKHADLTHNTTLASRVTVVVHPTAGPTPGNQGFANHMGDSVDYSAIINQNDAVPQAWDFEGLRELKGAYDNVDFGGVKLSPNKGIVHNFLRWAQSLPGSNIYRRRPKSAEKEFQVHEWRQKVYTSLDPDHPEKTKEMVNKFSGIFLHYKIFFNAQKLKGKYERNFRSQLAAFFLQMGAQHVKAYSNQTEMPESSGLVIPKKVQELMSAQYYKPTKDMEKWIIAQLIDELAELTKRAAQWLKKQPKLASLEEPQGPIAEFSNEREEESLSEEAFAPVLKDLQESVSSLPFFKNPLI